jgi:WD40 repeat protein
MRLTNAKRVCVHVRLGSRSLARPNPRAQVCLASLGSSGLRIESRWQAHDAETWTVAFDPREPSTLFTGADDRALKKWDRRYLYCATHACSHIHAHRASRFTLHAHAVPLRVHVRKCGGNRLTHRRVHQTRLFYSRFIIAHSDTHEQPHPCKFASHYIHVLHIGTQ